ncbi:FxsA family protein [Methylobacter sp. BlB1]|uniref:FxsA family protein n=1 Tax=Methylobacter sp. BlB1 TaxID=2785914 RepID=UPI00189572D4|nr:FxsA family protein [Methylobacter sp. BlB1]MBF6648171.1 FxsA family protein [Methylobacter sp. BlB1]
MKVFQIALLFLVVVPFVEIYLLLQVGGIIGAVPTIFLVVLTAVLGAWLLKQQGLATLQRFQASLAQGTLPAYEMIEGPILLVGGALLLTPGFITDIMGFACLIPQLRRKIAQYVIENHLIQAGGPFQPARPAEKDALEGEYHKED